MQIGSITALFFGCLDRYSLCLRTAYDKDTSQHVVLPFLNFRLPLPLQAPKYHFRSNNLTPPNIIHHKVKGSTDTHSQHKNPLLFVLWAGVGSSSSIIASLWYTRQSEGPRPPSTPYRLWAGTLRTLVYPWRMTVYHTIWYLDKISASVSRFELEYRHTNMNLPRRGVWASRVHAETSQRMVIELSPRNRKESYQFLAGRRNSCYLSNLLPRSPLELPRT